MEAEDRKPSKIVRWVLGLGETAAAVVQVSAACGFWMGSAAAAALGQFLLGGVLAVLGIGVLLRFKRLRQRAKP